MLSKHTYFKMRAYNCQFLDGVNLQQRYSLQLFNNLIKNRKQIQILPLQPMSLSQLRSRIVYILKNEAQQSIYLVLANNSHSKDGKVIDELSKTQLHTVFSLGERMLISQHTLMTQVEIRCVEEEGRIIMSKEEYRAIIKQVHELERKDQNDSSDNQDNSEEENDSQQPMRTKDPIKQYNEESSINNDDKHRGRGRPKGSKNKKTIIKQAMQLKEPPPIELKMALSGLIKRGKGRPKGSKNKMKDYTHPIKIQEGTESLPFGKRGKGRPKGSKNKIKLANQAIADQFMDNQQRRRKGRPPGAKNRANSVQSLSGQHQISEQFMKIVVQRPDLSQLQQIYCCCRCYQSQLKRHIFDNETNVEQNIEVLKNVFEDLGLQNKSNLIITAIKLGDWQSLEQLLSIVNRVENYYKSPWNAQKMIQRQRFETRTKKEYLSKTGKEGNTVLLHDSCRKRQIWWKEITVERIIQNLPREHLEATKILQKLFTFDLNLKTQIYMNLACIIRSGNFAVSQIILRDVVFTSTSNKLNFSQQHYDLLTGSMLQINHFKKFNLVRPNDGISYCSPIHAAAICPHPQFLRKMLMIFTDVINVEDSLHRKPVHYAALANTSDNIKTLFESGADLREYDRKKMTPLMLACYEGIFYNVEYILEKVRDGVYINSKSEEGYTALHYAILRDNIECVQMLINDPFIDLWTLTRDKGDIFHLLAGTGNTQIMDLILKKEYLPYNSLDKFKKTPPMIAIRNNNNDCLVKLIENGCRMDKAESSLNTLLHYAAAYGNIQAIMILRDQVEQVRNKRGLIPWQLAVYKGHLGAAQLLERQLDQDEQFHEDPLYFTLTCIRGTTEYMECVRYVAQKMMADIQHEQKNTGNGYLHLVCQISEQEYLKVRGSQSGLSVDQIREEYGWIQQQLINFFVQRGLGGYQQNFNGETPLKLCIENNNLIGVQKLMTGRITFEIQPSSQNNILHCLSNLACRGLEQMRFVERKLKECSQGELKTNVKKIDHCGFDFLLYFVKNFTEKVVFNFKKSIKKYHPTKKERSNRHQSLEQQTQKRCFEEFLKFEQRFMGLVDFLLELGCDINAQVVDRKNQTSEQYRKWGIQHFLMRFPSLRLVKFFKAKIRDFNSQNNQLMTPLHLFCKYVKGGSLLDTTAILPADYRAENVLEFLLQSGLNPNCYDASKALPLLYAAVNGQYDFIVILRKYRSQVNLCTTRNEIPFIEIIKQSRNFTIEQIQQLLVLGMDPNYLDMNRRNSLHHLVFHASNLDSNPQVCKLLLEWKTRINALDKYDRSPIFYCFCEMQGEESGSSPLQKVEILQVLMNHKDINLNLLDLYQRSLLHYACLDNHFFSILYLLDKNINIEARDYQDNTPLALSLKTRNLDQVTLIISKGVKYGFVHEDGEKLSYFAYAFRKLSAGICFMLLDNGYPIQKALEQIPDSSFKQTLIQKYILRN